jgi:hypothetical protein
MSQFEKMIGELYCERKNIKPEYLEVSVNHDCSEVCIRYRVAEQAANVERMTMKSALELME